MRIARPILLAALAAVTIALAGGAAAKSLGPKVDVIASSENSGPVAWKLWRVSNLAGGEIQRLAIRLAPGSLNLGALRTLNEGTVVGTATISQQLSSDNGATGTGPLELRPCAGGLQGSEATLRFTAIGSGAVCVPVAVDQTSDGAALLTTPLAGVTGPVWLDLRFDNRDTTAGPLIPPNPQEPIERDTTATVVRSDMTSGDLVREISGGETRLEISAEPDHVVYGRPVVISGRVLRANGPSAGEKVKVHEFYFSEANTDIGPAVYTVTDENGGFRVTVHPKSLVRWGAWAWKPAGSGGPRTNLLPGVLASPLAVRAPQPTIVKRAVHRLANGLIGAEVVVHNPIWRRETLYGRLYVDGRRVAVRRFPFSSGELVFRVRGESGTRVRVAIGRWDGYGPGLAAGWSRIVRL